jgi:hypothetical protein
LPYINNTALITQQQDHLPQEQKKQQEALSHQEDQLNPQEKSRARAEQNTNS